MPCKDCGNTHTIHEGTMLVSTCNITVCGNRFENLKAKLDRYKAALEEIDRLFLQPGGVAIPDGELRFHVGGWAVEIARKALKACETPKI